MTAAERKIRFDVALEMVESIYHDYCHDESKTRAQAYNFCCLVQEMLAFAATLSGEAKAADNGQPQITERL